MTNSDMARRVATLERRQQRLTVTMTMAALLAGGLACVAAADLPKAPDTLRVRGITVVDATGVARIEIGAPVPSGAGETGARRSPATGITMHGSDGRERLGLGVFDDGATVLGFDAAPDPRRPANRERLHLGVDPAGRGFVRLLDQEANLAGRLRLDERDRAALELWGKPADTGQGQVRQRGRVELDGWSRMPDHIAPAARP